MAKQFWLMKSEPEVFGLDTLAKLPAQTTMWDGVRNYQARNMMRDQFKLGDEAFFYHSNCSEPGVVGIVEVVRTAYADPTQFNPESEYFDPKSTAENPRWFVVDVKLKRALKRTVTLMEMKEDPALADMALVRKGNRLSVLPVTPAQWRHILARE